jgi:putative ABC transport system ATP-binding protein
MKILEVKDVRKTYGYDDYKVHAVNHISLSIEEGSFVAIVGKSGSGKSTLLHIMGGLTRPNKGKVILEGHSLYEMKDNALSRYRRRRMGFVFQFYNLISSLNVIENIVLPMHLDHMHVDEDYLNELLELLDIKDKKTAFVRELSGGQQQRVAIARALAMKPAIILADEPTGNLDAKSSQEVVSLLKLSQRKYKQTLILVTHDDMLASQADRIITIEDGKIVGDSDER